MTSAGVENMAAVHQTEILTTDLKNVVDRLKEVDELQKSQAKSAIIKKIDEQKKAHCSLRGEIGQNHLGNETSIIYMPFSTKPQHKLGNLTAKNFFSAENSVTFHLVSMISNFGFFFEKKTRKTSEFMKFNCSKG